MPATFAHCLVAREAIGRLPKKTAFSQIMKMHNNFVITGAAGPDYPYLTDVIKYQKLHIGHNWADRMHYENVGDFIMSGMEVLSSMDRGSDKFGICLSWFAGYVSHVIADSYFHPVVNRTVGGTYLFTRDDHGRCELIQDIYIFKKMITRDIVEVGAKDTKMFGFLDILDDSSESSGSDKIHHDIRDFWTELLKMAHPTAAPYFKDINPDEWHKNYKSRVDFAADRRPISRHMLGLLDVPTYFPEKEIDASERLKYIDKIILPNGNFSSYETMFKETVKCVVSMLIPLLSVIGGEAPASSLAVKDWNLDTGVDESKIDMWMEV